MPFGKCFSSISDETYIQTEMHNIYSRVYKGKKLNLKWIQTKYPDLKKGRKESKLMESVNKLTSLIWFVKCTRQKVQNFLRMGSFRSCIHVVQQRWQWQQWRWRCRRRLIDHLELKTHQLKQHVVGTIWQTPVDEDSETTRQVLYITSLLYIWVCTVIP